MISEQSALRQVLRFADLQFYPKDPTELILAYRTAFEKDYQAEDFTKEWIQFNDLAPKPANIYERGRQIAKQMADRWEQRKPGVFDCPICEDVGYVQVEGQSAKSVGSSTRCICLLAKIEKQRLEGKFK